MKKFLTLIIILVLSLNNVNAEEPELVASATANIDSSSGVVLTTSSYDSELYGGYVESTATAFIIPIEVQDQTTTLTSEAYAQGTYTGGNGAVIVNDIVDMNTAQISNGLLESGMHFTHVIVQYTVNNNINNAMTFAWAWASNELPTWTQPEIIEVKKQTNGFFGWTFGKSDAERYYHLKQQISISCENVDIHGETIDKSLFETDEQYNMCARSVYLIEIILNDYGLTSEEFEVKYPLTKVIELNSDFVKKDDIKTLYVSSTSTNRNTS